MSDSFLRSLVVDAEGLSEFVSASLATRRLGRYMESLTEFVVLRALAPSRLRAGVSVVAGKRTIGELDLLFSHEGVVDCHWELSVKFYICVGSGLSSYVGTFVEDRLDKKLDHLLNWQLPLVESPEARALLAADGWTRPFDSRVLMKGLLFYPASSWQTFAAPSELSGGHERGWWTTSGSMEFPRMSTESSFILLEPFEWLGRFRGTVATGERSVMSLRELEDYVRTYFADDLSEEWLRRRGLTVAEVVREGDGADDGSGVWREIARGHIVHAKWPALAKRATEMNFDELELSRRAHSKRPPRS